MRRAPGQRLHQRAVRRARRRRDLRHAVRAPGRRATRRRRASRVRPGRSPSSTPSAWPPATTRPVLQVNYEYYDNQTPDSALDLVTALQAGRATAPDPRRAADRFPHRRTGDRRDLHRSGRAGGGADRVGADPARLGAGRAHRPARARRCRTRSSSRRCRRRNEEPSDEHCRADDPGPRSAGAGRVPASRRRHPGRSQSVSTEPARAPSARRAPVSRRADPGDDRARSLPRPPTRRPARRSTPRSAARPRRLASTGRPRPTAPPR